MITRKSISMAACVALILIAGLTVSVIQMRKASAMNLVVKNGQGFAVVYGPAEVCGQFSNIPQGNVEINVSEVTPGSGNLRVDVITQAHYYYTFGQGACIPIYVKEVAPFSSNRSLPYVYFNTGQVVELTENQVSGEGSPDVMFQSYAEFNGDINEINDVYLALSWNGILSCKIQGVECGDDLSANSFINSEVITLAVP